jgi:hypothetical protein
MTWDEATAAVTLLAEERVGRRVRESEAIEDAKYQRSVAELRKGERRAR